MYYADFQRQLIKIQHVITAGFADYLQVFIFWIDYYDKMHATHSKVTFEVTAWPEKAG